MQFAAIDKVISLLVYDFPLSHLLFSYEKRMLERAGKN
jgi:hypothetical protein